MVRRSENCTIRLVVFRDGGSAAAQQSVINAFKELGVDGEGIERFGMIALDVPPTADLAKVQSSSTTVWPRNGGTWKRGASPRSGAPFPPSDHKRRPRGVRMLDRERARRPGQPLEVRRPAPQPPAVSRAVDNDSSRSPADQRHDSPSNSDDASDPGPAARLSFRLIQHRSRSFRRDRSRWPLPRPDAHEHR